MYFTTIFTHIFHYFMVSTGYLPLFLVKNYKNMQYSEQPKK